MYQSFIGLEVHIHLATRTKCFCGCRAAFGDEPNTNVCPVCLGYPGSLPALNARGGAPGLPRRPRPRLHARGAHLFERKNYFYPDMPKNYQISQFRSPIGVDGRVEIELRKRRRAVRIREVHLEEDAGKMIHAGDATLLDYNRAGTSLLEIVTQPDLEMGEEAEVFLQHLRRLVRWLGVCDGNMEEGSLRCDANVSVNLAGPGPRQQGRDEEPQLLQVRAPGPRLRDRAPDGDPRPGRHRPAGDAPVEREPRRHGSHAHQGERARLPLLPRARPAALHRRRRVPRLGRGVARRASRSAGAPVRRHASASPRRRRSSCARRSPSRTSSRQSVRLGADPQSAALWLAADVRKHLNRLGGLDRHGPPDARARFAELLALLASRRIHGRIAKAVLDAVFAEDKDPEAIIAEKGLGADHRPPRGGPSRSTPCWRRTRGWWRPSAAATPTRGLPRRRDHARPRPGRADPGLVQELVTRAARRSPWSRCCRSAGRSPASVTEAGEVEAGDLPRPMRSSPARTDCRRNLPSSRCG